MKNKSSKLNEKLKAVSRKLKASLSIPFKKLVPGLVLLSFVLSGILAPISFSKSGLIETKMSQQIHPENRSTENWDIKSEAYTKSGGKQVVQM